MGFSEKVEFYPNLGMSNAIPTTLLTQKVLLERAKNAKYAYFFVVLNFFLGGVGMGRKKNFFSTTTTWIKLHIHDKCSTIDILDEDWAILGCKVVLCLSSSLSEHPAHRPQNMPCVLILMGLTGMLSYSIFLF